MLEYLSAFTAASSQVFTLNTFSLMLIGIAIGFAVGILPGLGGPTVLALMLPFTFHMSPVEAFAFARHARRDRHHRRHHVHPLRRSGRSHSSRCCS